jgi:hypothetical protein
MTVRSSIDPARLLEEQLAQASPDLLRELLQTFINTLLSAEADAVCGAEYGTTTARSSARHHQRGRRRLAGVLSRPGRPRPDRGQAGHQRRPSRARRRDRRHPERCRVVSTAWARARTSLLTVRGPMRSVVRDPG